MKGNVAAGLRRFAWLIVAAVAVLAASAQVAQAAGDAVSSPGWDLLRSATWPAALAAVALSPLGRAVGEALAFLMGSWARPAAPGSGLPGGHDSETTEILRELAGHFNHSAEVQTETVEALRQIQSGLAILLDRTPRNGGMKG